MKKKNIIIFTLVFIISGTVAPYCSESFIAGSIYALRNKIENKQCLISNSESGIPVVDYGIRMGVYVGKNKNPATISFAALDYFREYESTKKNIYRDLFLNCANWLVDNSVVHQNYAILEYKFYYPDYDMRPPWRSALAQGLAVSVLGRAYFITKEKKYLDAAGLLLKAFFIEKKDGGVTYKNLVKNGWWYEEYAVDKGKEPMVFNGMMHTLLALHDYYIFTKDNQAKLLFDKGVAALIEYLPYFDRHGTCYYDIFNASSSIFYHNVCVVLLNDLYQITKISVFKKYYDNWKYYKFSSFAGLVVHPTKIGAAIFLINFIVLSFIIFIFLGITRKSKRRQK